MRIGLLSLLLLGAVSVAFGQPDNDCDRDLEEVDYAMLADIGAQETGAQKEITLDKLKEEMAANILQEDKDDIEEDEELATGSNYEFERTSELSAVLLPYYKPVCPRRYYWLRRYYWYWYYPKDTYKYCWPYTSVWVTSCSTRYCSWGYNNPYNWYYYLRCTNVYRPTYVRFLCAYPTNDDGTTTWTWVSRYKRIWLPRDCSCMRYTRYIATNSCAVVGK